MYMWECKPPCHGLMEFVLGSRGGPAYSGCSASSIFSASALVSPVDIHHLHIFPKNQCARVRSVRVRKELPRIRTFAELAAGACSDRKTRMARNVG